MNIEEFINKNRRELDRVEDVPSDIIWHGIQERRRKRSTIFRLRIYSIAATVLLLIAAAVILKLSIPGTDSRASNYISAVDFKEEEYFRIVAEKKAEIEYDNLNKEQYGEIIRELDMLDSMYSDIKQEIAEMPNAERAVQTAIKFHERRLRILELLEKEIENQKRIEYNENTVNI